MPHPKVFLGFWYHLPAIHRGVIRRARELGWDLRTNANDLAVPSGESYDGIILQYGVLPALDAIADAMPGRAVDLTRRVPGAKLDRVYSDGVAAGILAAEYLMASGHRRFVAVRGRHWGDDDKCKGFLDTLSAAGHRAEVWNLGALAGDSCDAPGVASPFLRERLGELAGSAAVFCLHDTHGDLLLREARDLEIAVPTRLAVLGCGDDALLCEGSPPSLSSIDLNLEAVGYEAARRLDELMRGAPGGGRAITVPPAGVVVRMSTGGLGQGSPPVRRALEILEKMPEAQPSVDELARLVGVNRRALERAFKTDLGCGPLEHMIRRRVERAAGLMRENPGMSGPAVSERLGYESVSHFYRQFSKIKGMSVGEFRRRFVAPGP